MKVYAIQPKYDEYKGYLAKDEEKVRAQLRFRALQRSAAQLARATGDRRQ